MPKGQLRTYGSVARIQAPSHAVAAAAVLAAPALADRIKIFPNLINHAALTAASAQRSSTPCSPPPAPRPVRLGYIGRIHPEKGLHLLVTAAALLASRPDAASLPPWQLILRGPLDIPRGGGGDAFAAELRALAPDLFASGQISFAPPEFDAPALAAAYAHLDVFVYPSLAERGETFGVSVAEAMAAGCAPIISDLPCFTDLVTPDVHGLAFRRHAPAPAAELSAHLATLLLDPARRAALASAAQIASARCAAPTVATAMLEDFTTLLHP
jgi:glycosyltransferase involved in cell wall biosynthesis